MALVIPQLLKSMGEWMGANLSFVFFSILKKRKTILAWRNY